MTDRELLEAAAKAAGCNAEEWYDDGQFSGFLQPLLLGQISSVWNPLIDDGDALRLAVKLGLHISWSRPRFLGTRVLASSEIVRIYVAVAEGVTREQATRRAIVRAAAAMAKEDV